LQTPKPKYHDVLLPEYQETDVEAFSSPKGD